MENTGLRFFTEVKSCWAGSVSGFVTIPVYPVLYALREGLAWWSSLAPPPLQTSVGLVWVDVTLTWGFFLQVSRVGEVFLPPQKINPQMITSGWGCAQDETWTVYTLFSKIAVNKLFFFLHVSSLLCLIFTSGKIVFYTCWQSKEG